MNLREVLIRFKPFYIKYWKHFFIAIIGMILASVGTAGSFSAIKPIIDKIFIEKNETMLYIVPFFLVFAYLLKNCGMYLQTYYVSYIGTNILKTLRSLVLENLLRLDILFFKKHRSGELISRCTNDINALQMIVSSIIPDFLREFFTALGLLIVVIYHSPKLSFFALIVLPLVVFPLIWFARKLKKYAKRGQEKNADLLSRLSEIFSNIELVKANNTEKKEKAKFDVENSELCKIQLKNTRVDALISPLIEIFGSFGVAIVIIIGGKEVIQGVMTPGDFFTFVSALFAIYNPLKRMTSLYGKLQIAVVASERTFYLLDLKPQIQGGAKELENINHLEFKQVKFAYDEHKEVLKGIDFAFKKGEILAFVGPSGGGKTSIIGLILHFFQKKSGQILINGEELDNFSLESLRSKIALVTQDIYIFNDTIAQNIAYSGEIDEEKIIEVLKLANAYDFVMQMGGIHTEIFEHGKNLSGGQKQRIAIARALYKKPDLLIFDESTSALDNASERAIVQTIEKLKKEHLILMIAHRLSTIENADKIALLDEGKIVAIGSDEELMRFSSVYQNFKNQKDKAEL